MNGAPDPGDLKPESWLRWAFVACLVHAVLSMGVGWNHSILGLHGFRQTQTAMAVEYLLAGSSWLRYETPFLGVPWSIPFEFPLFQWIVAAISAPLGTPIVQTADIGYFRLRDEGYKDKDIEHWSREVAKYAENARDVFVYFKHEEQGLGPEFAKRLMALL
jgi:hypothetical protein